MGWSDGSQLAEDVWMLVRKYIPKKDRKGIAQRIIELFEMGDCDTMSEAEKLYKDGGIEND